MSAIASRKRHTEQPSTPVQKRGRPTGQLSVDQIRSIMATFDDREPVDFSTMHSGYRVSEIVKRATDLGVDMFGYAEEYEQLDASDLGTDDDVRNGRVAPHDVRNGAAPPQNDQEFYTARDVYNKLEKLVAADGRPAMYTLLDFFKEEYSVLKRIWATPARKYESSNDKFANYYFPQEMVVEVTLSMVNAALGTSIRLDDIKFFTRGARRRN